MKIYELIEHTADVGIKAYGKNISEAFENAAKGMFDIITDKSEIEAVGEYIFIKITGKIVEEERRKGNVSYKIVGVVELQQGLKPAEGLVPDSHICYGDRTKFVAIRSHRTTLGQIGNRMK